MADQVAALSVLELSEYVKILEEKFGVTAAAPMMMGAIMAAPAAGGVCAADVFHGREPVSGLSGDPEGDRGGVVGEQRESRA